MSDYQDDELIDVKLPRKDYETLREIIRKQEALTWLGRYTRNVLLIAAGGFLTLVAFWEQLKAMFTGHP